MPIGIRNLEWTNHNAQRAYPIVVEATRSDLSEQFELPVDFIVALYLPIHWANDIDPGKFFISKVAAYETGFSIVVGYASDSGTIDVASTQIVRSAHTQNQVYSLYGLGDFYDSKGHIQIGSLEAIDLQPTGLFEFDLSGSRLEPDAVRPHIQGLVSIQADNGGELTEELTNIVRLQAGKNCRITAQIESGKSPRLIFSAIEGENLTESCVCDDETAPPIRTINGLPGDSNNNFQLLGNDCMEIVGGNHSLAFNDICSEPCCGCKELEAITQAMEALGDKAATMERYLSQLGARSSQMELTVLGSKTGDRGCTGGLTCPE